MSDKFYKSLTIHSFSMTTFWALAEGVVDLRSSSQRGHPVSFMPIYKCPQYSTERGHNDFVWWRWVATVCACVVWLGQMTGLANSSTVIESYSSSLISSGSFHQPGNPLCWNSLTVAHMLLQNMSRVFVGKRDTCSYVWISNTCMWVELKWDD